MTRAGAPTPLFQRDAQIFARHIDSGNKPEHDSRCQRNNNRKYENAPVHRDACTVLANSRDVPGIHRKERANAEKPKDESQGASQYRKHDAFCKQLTNDADAARAHCRSDSDLAFSATCPHKQKVGHVCASDQQHKHDCACEDPERRLRIADDGVLERLNAKAVSGAHDVGESLAEIIGGKLKLSVRRGGGHSGLQPPDNIETLCVVGAVGINLKGRKASGGESSSVLKVGDSTPTTSYGVLFNEIALPVICGSPPNW